MSEREDLDARHWIASFKANLEKLESAFIAVLKERDATEAERKHWQMTAGCLRTDLEYMTRRAEQAEAVLKEKTS